MPGPIYLIGSGETSPSGRKVFDHAFRAARLRRPSQDPPRVSILETPAGFELNSERVAGRVAEFIRGRLQNYHPEVTLVPARKRGTPFSPDRAEIADSILRADLIFMGPGSPTYAVRQLEDSLTWHALIARHRLGAALVLASAAVVAAGAYALPVYEIYKVGEELHWKPGLDLLGFYGLSLVFIPHWNNAEGGEGLDTSRCFIGQERFERLVEMLPAQVKIIGIDEKTTLEIDFLAGKCAVQGLGGVSLLQQGQAQRYGSGQDFSLLALGEPRLVSPEDGLPPGVWQRAVQAQARSREVSPIPGDIQSLVEARQAARERQDWQAADRLREQLSVLGWQVRDTPEGPEVEPQGKG